jgi:hypothetical protein
MSNQVIHAGGCQCGAVRFNTSDQPLYAMACHCTTCKQRTGGAYGIGVYFNNEEVQFTNGSTKSFEFRSDESDRWLCNEFCEDCGSTVSWTLENRPGVTGLAGGCYDEPNWFSVEAHIWTRSARSDVCYPDHVKICEESFFK